MAHPASHAHAFRRRGSEQESRLSYRRGEYWQPDVTVACVVVRDGRLLLDCRTLTDAEVDEVAAAVAAARG